MPYRCVCVSEISLNSIPGADSHPHREYTCQQWSSRIYSGIPLSTGGGFLPPVGEPSFTPTGPPEALLIGMMKVSNEFSSVKSMACQLA